MRLPTFDPTRISRASTVPEPCKDESRRNQPAENAKPAPMPSTTSTMTITRLRFIARFSSQRLRFRPRHSYRLARGHAHPQNFHGSLDALRQGCVTIDRPHEQRPEYGLAKHLG